MNEVEVNNNVNHDLDLGIIKQQQQHQQQQHPEEDDPNDDDGKNPNLVVYSDGGNVRIEVEKAEEWLCVARMPLDLRQEELKDILGQFGVAPVEVHLIKSQKTGMVFRLKINIIKRSVYNEVIWILLSGYLSTSINRAQRGRIILIFE